MIVVGAGPEELSVDDTSDTSRDDRRPAGMSASPDTVISAESIKELNSFELEISLVPVW